MIFFTRIYSKKNPFKGDKNHLHHYLQDKIGSKKSLFIYIAVLTLPIIWISIFNIHQIIVFLFSFVCTKDVIKPYITQSWLNYTTIKEYHHVHFHPNSFLSGVFYFDAIEGVDCIRFHKAKYQTIMPDVYQFNDFNCEFYNFSVKTNQIIIFPSHLTHSVPAKENKNTRISLAFNTFITGTVSASDTRLKQLIIPSK